MIENISCIPKDEEMKKKKKCAIHAFIKIIVLQRIRKIIGVAIIRKEDKEA